jgi:hypothetical protein
VTNNSISISEFKSCSDAEFRAEIEAVARQIEHFERCAIFKIADRLAWVHEQFLYQRDEGGLQRWVESRLGYSRTQPYRMLDVAKLIKSIPDWDTFGTLPVTALYQLAAPSTPVQVRDEIVNRLKAGERMSCATVAEVITKAKGDVAAGLQRFPFHQRDWHRWDRRNCGRRGRIGGSEKSALWPPPPAIIPMR